MAQTRHPVPVSNRWSVLREALKEALREFVIGNAEPYKALWSHSDDVSIMGAFGGYNRGWDDISGRLDWAAAQYHNGVYDLHEILNEVVGTDLAYTVWREKITSTDAAGGTIVRHRRGTQIYRLEGADWRIVHQHTDPLVEVAVSPA
jgi:ketosteroid isomerase-like protein